MAQAAQTTVDEKGAMGKLKLFCALSVIGVILLIVFGLGLLVLIVALYLLREGLLMLQPKYKNLALPAKLVMANYLLLALGIVLLIVVLFIGGGSAVASIVGIVALTCFLLGGNPVHHLGPACHVQGRESIFQGVGGDRSRTLFIRAHTRSDSALSGP